MLRCLLVCAAATTGCAHYYKLDVKSVTALEVSGDARSLICARGALVDVRAVTKDGKKFAEGDREHPKENEFDPTLVKLEASTGSFHDRSWNPPDDALALLSVDEITITATLIANPQITATTKVAPTWACDAPVAYLGGDDGGQGDSGIQDGADGSAGGHGNNGQNVVVTIGSIQHGDGQLAIADVQSDSGESVYVLDPRTPLKVLAGGGAGGAGGMGAFGAGTDNCDGRGGPGGRGGDGGDGGDGGTVTIRYDASSPELARLVIADVHGGDAGPGGDGGSGGAGPNGCGEWGKSGEAGREGRGGREGRVSTQPSSGINQQLAALSHGGPRPSAPRHAAQPVAPRETADGARYYAGRAEITAALAHRRPEHQRMMLRIESTRTRRHHFTIAFGECKLELHRPPNEQQHRYVLDAPATCESGTGSVEIRDALLELDTKSDRLGLSWKGVGQAKGQPGPMTVDFAFAGQRR